MMKKLIRITFCLLFLSTASLSAQEEVVVESGKYYRIYQVEQGEGFFALQRKFNLTARQLLDVNPELKEGIKRNQRLKIPISNEEANDLIAKGSKTTKGMGIEQPATAIPATRLTSAVTVKRHMIAPKETLYSVSKRYGLTTQQLVKLNPGLSPENFSIGREIVIETSPVKVEEMGASAPVPSLVYSTTSERASTEANHPVATSPKKEIRRYVVSSGETLFSLSRKFKVSIEDIITANGGKDQISVGDILILPSQAALPAGESSDISGSSILGGQVFHPVKAALLLPFNLGSTNSQEIENRARFIDYYRGVLLAIDSLKMNGVSIDLTVIDTRNDNLAIDSLLRSQALQGTQFVIGPVLQGQINFITPYLDKNDIAMVVPFSSKVDLKHSGLNSYQINPSHLLIQKEAVRGFCEMLPEGANVVFISNKSVVGDKSEYVAELKKELRKRSTQFKQFNYETDSIAAIRQLLVEEVENVLVFETSQSKELGSLLPNVQAIKSVAPMLQLTLWGYPEWQTYFAQFSESFFALNTHIFASFYADVTTLEYRTVSQKFNTYFNQPMLNTYPRYSLLGFDTSYYFLNGYACRKQVDNTRPVLVSKTGFQSGFDFEGTSHLVNRSLFVVNFKPTFEVVRKKL